MYTYDPDELGAMPPQPDSPQSNLSSAIHSESSSGSDTEQTEPEIDPKNPFGNETEFIHYNTDYGEIVPQIRMKGCKIPLFPNRQEKGRIHRYENIVGGFMIGHLVLSNILFVVLMELFYCFTTLVDRTAAGGELPSNYSDLLTNYFESSASYMAMTMLCYTGVNILVFCLGCKATKIPVSNLLQTTDFHIQHVLVYIPIALAIKTAAIYIDLGVTEILNGIGIVPYEVDYTLSTDVRYVLISFIYSVIAAPIGEELLFRGFIQKNLCRFGQKFGIITTAFFFGIWHENLSQCILAFLVGCFFGYITVKHNSIIPSIMAHMTINLSSEIFSILETYQLELVETIYYYFYILLILMGVVLLIRMMMTERFPKAMPAQTERGLRVALTSPALLFIFFCHIGAMVLYTVLI